MEVCFDNTHLTNNNETSAHQLKTILYCINFLFSSITDHLLPLN